MTTTPFAQLTALAQAIAWRCSQTKNQFHPQVPSVSAIADATADAVATWAERFPRTCLSPRNLTGGRRKAVARLLRRAAFSSLEQTSRHGVTGTSSVSLAFAAALDTERSDHTEASWTGPRVCAEERKAAVRLLRQLARPSVQHEPPGYAKRHEQACRSRFKVFVRIIYGETVHDAIRGEYKTLVSFYRSIKQSGLLGKLDLAFPGLYHAFSGIRSHGYYQPKS